MQNEVLDKLVSYSFEDLDKVYLLHQDMDKNEHFELCQQIIFRKLERMIDLQIYLAFICHETMEHLTSLPKLLDEHCLIIAARCPVLQVMQFHDTRPNH
jgi:hypothetical protein